MKLSHAVTAAALAIFAAAVPATAQEQVKVGVLRCQVSAGLGLIITSSKTMNCAFSATNGSRERYVGSVRKFGLDIGGTSKGVMVWTVLAPSRGTPRGALAGDYVGADASLTLGAGAGANLLVGGFGRSISLQPFSVEAQTGLALAAGVQALQLTAAR